MVAARSVRIGVGYAPVRGAPFVFAWDTEYSTSNAAFSNGNLTATFSPAGGLVRANKANSTGYFEVTCTTVAGGAFEVGLAYSDDPNTNPIRGDGVAYRFNGQVYYDGVLQFTGSTFTSGDVIGVYLDENDGNAYFSKNGVWQNGANPSARTGGINVSAFYPTFPFYPAAYSDLSSGTAVVTANFGASPFAYAIPSNGFSWDGTQTGPPVTSAALTGQSVTGDIGSLLASTAAPLTGGALAASQGSVAPQTSLALSGQPLAAAQGSVGANVTIALTGLALGVAQGSVTGGQPITGQQASVAQGSTTANVSVALTGLSLGVAQGSVIAAPSLALSGQSLSVARGTVAPATSLALAGQALAVAQGSVAAAFSFALNGQQLSVSQGTITASSGNVTVALTGLQLGVAQGSVAPATSAALVGQALTAARGTVAPATSAPLAGQALSAAQGALAAAISRQLSGQTLAVAQGAITVSLGAGQIKVYLGSYTAKPVKVWNGSAWVVKPLKYWNGSIWTTTT